MLNARWIRNGGTKGVSMTATSKEEVKTAGAYEALALYVNKSLSFVPSDYRYWDADVSKRRWVSLYKSFKEPMLLKSKGNSTAGCTLEEIQNNATSLLAKQKLKCASCEVLPYHAACEWCTCFRCAWSRHHALFWTSHISRGDDPQQLQLGSN